MFTGDNILGHGTSAVEELGTYMASLVKMKEQNCAVGHSAHGCVIDNLPGKIGSELAQKWRRERQVLQVLKKLKKEAAGAMVSVTVKELVTAMYGEEIDDQLRELALEPFMDEVLRKLAEDGKVGYEMKKKVKKWFWVEQDDEPVRPARRVDRKVQVTCTVTPIVDTIMV